MVAIGIILIGGIMNTNDSHNIDLVTDRFYERANPETLFLDKLCVDSHLCWYSGRHQ